MGKISSRFVEGFKKLEDDVSMQKSDNTKYYAHRGSPLSAPENTIISYQHAGDNGKFYGFECDLGLTSDGAWVLMHDTTLDRTTTGTGLVSDSTLAEVKALDAGSWFDVKYAGTKVPTFAEFLNTCREYGTTAQSEIKAGAYTSSDYTTLLDVIKQSGVKVVISSFDITVLQAVRAIDTEIGLAFLQTTYSESGVDACVSLTRCVYVNNYTTVSDVSYAKSNGIPIEVYTINQSTDRDAMLRLGISAFITDNLIGEVA